MAQNYIDANLNESRTYNDFSVHHMRGSSIADPLSTITQIVHNSHEWVNIQEIVRSLFKLVTDKMTEQDSQIKYLITQNENVSIVYF